MLDARNKLLLVALHELDASQLLHLVQIWPLAVESHVQEILILLLPMQIQGRHPHVGVPPDELVETRGFKSILFEQAEAVDGLLRGVETRWRFFWHGDELLGDRGFLRRDLPIVVSEDVQLSFGHNISKSLFLFGDRSPSR